MSTPTAATNGSEGGAAKNGQQQQQRGGAAAGKALDGQRKGNNASPAATAAGEGGRKQKAWSGTNPTILAQRSATPNGTATEKPLPKLPSQAQQQQNNNSKQQQQPQPQPEVNGIADKHAHDRLLYVLGNCVGLDATIGLKSGEQFTGVFTGFSSPSTNHNSNGGNGKYILSMVRRTHAAPPQQQNDQAQTNGHATPTTESSSEEFIGEGEDHTLAFDIQDTTCLSVDDVIVSAPPSTQQNGTAIQPASTGFMTDTQISSSRAQPGQQRELQRWDAGQDTDVDLSLESGGVGEWDQFATNESKFGVGSTYKEEYYTTSIDRSDPGYRRREQEAERIAREMEGESTKNGTGGRGAREEGLDEEDKYSGVRREGLDTKLGSIGGGGSARESAGLLPKRKEGAYVPPRERPITGGPAPGVNGAPWDPAIIATSKPAPKETAQQGSTGAGGTTPTIVEPQEKSAQPAPPSASREASQTPRTTQQQQQQQQQQQATASTTAENSTQDHISKTIDAFKLFASNEKLKVRQQQELKRAGARQEKNVKLNDLKKFAANFKLNSRVPDDLVPILAKDREKQVAIQKAAEAAAKEAELSPKKVGSGEGKRGSPLGRVKEGGGKVEGGNGKAAGMGGEVSRGEKLRGAQVLQQQMRTAQGGSAQSPRSPAFPQQSRNGSGHGQHQGFGRGGGAAGQAQGMPAQQQLQQSHAPLMQAPSSSQAPPPPQLPAVRIPDGPAGWQGGAGAPLSPASRFNINAMEFRPIAANLAGTTPSPKRKGSATTNATAVAPEPTQQKTNKISSDSFFGKGGKPIEEQDRKDADEEYDPIKRMLAQKDFASEVEKKAVLGNGGVVQPFKTGPTWPGKEGESFLAGFQKHQLLVEQPAMQVAAQALQHQLPPPHHVQGPPPQGMVGIPSQRHQQYFAGQNTPQHGGFPDPRMMGQQFGGSVQSSPRFQSAQMAGFGGQIPPHMQQQGGPQMPGPQYGGGVGGQGYGMSPSMQQRQMMPQQQQQGIMMQGPQQYGQANGRFQGRRGSKGGQQQQQQWGGGPDERGQRGGFPAPQHFGGGGGVPMMQTLSQQGHGGQFMNGPPPANMGGGYSPMPHQAQMQGGYSGSPGRPTMMAHSGSHQGFNPQQQQQMHGMHGGPPPPQGPGMQQQGQPFVMGPGGAHPMHWQQQQRQMSGGYGGGPSPQHSGGMTPRSQQAMPMLQQGGGGGGHSGLNSPAAVGMGQGGEEVKGG
ncbi:poly(A)-binding protein binding protein [Elasticomyces elasticus]|nr:poly(A)-binding protein binding protein [Elasticomyces elasticus]